MQITRIQHLRYMAKLTPLLLFLYAIQSALYFTFAPYPLASDVNLFLGIGLALIILGYHFYDWHHKVLMHPNYMEIRFDLLGKKDEIIYQNIDLVEIRKKKNHYAHVVLHLRDGSTCHLHHVDSPELITEFIEKKKSRKLWTAV